VSKVNRYREVETNHSQNDTTNYFISEKIYWNKEEKEKYED